MCDKVGCDKVACERECVTKLRVKEGGVRQSCVCETACGTKLCMKNGRSLGAKLGVTELRVLNLCV